jgi:2'-5' RNA ligase
MSETQRLFLAITPPETVRQTLVGLQQPLRNVRWTPVNQLHLTIRFLGDVDGATSDALIERLARLHVEPFTLPLEGAGVFPLKGAPRVLWVGVGSGHPRLHQLRQQVDDAVVSVSPVADVSTFHPHVTVARCNESAHAGVTAWARVHREFAGPVFLVDSINLYASDRLPAGAVYRLVKLFPLNPSA